MADKEDQKIILAIQIRTLSIIIWLKEELRQP